MNGYGIDSAVRQIVALRRYYDAREWEEIKRRVDAVTDPPPPEVGPSVATLLGIVSAPPLHPQ